MKNFLAIGVALIALASFNAAAAQPPSAPAPVYSWTGFYVGGNLGYGWGNADNAVTFIDPNFELLGAPPPTAVHSETDKLPGLIGGGQVGYNWQFLPHGVLGFEADWQGSGQKTSRSFVDSFVEQDQGANTDTVNTNYAAKIAWFGTVRGRIGYAWEGLLFYGTAGLAYGEVKLAGTLSEAVNPAGFPPTNGTTPFNISKVNTGWTAGGGIEGALANSWTWKIEYLYLDLGSIAAGASPAGAFPLPFGGTISEQSRFTSNILRAGLNFKLN